MTTSTDKDSEKLNIIKNEMYRFLPKFIKLNQQS